MATCEVCGKNPSKRMISQMSMCDECFGDLQKIRSGDLQICNRYLNEFEYASIKANKYFHEVIIDKIGDNPQTQQNNDIDMGADEQSYNNSINEYYEYDVESIINEDHGRVDKDTMSFLLNERAKKGWRLHTVYSNELGKNALRVLGFGANVTACEDVLIFERKKE